MGNVNKFLESALKRTSKSKEIKEIDIESSFCKFAKSKKCVPLKLIILNKRGFPDRTVLCPKGRIFFIEFKRKNKSQSAIQKTLQRTLTGLGFEYYVCDEIGQAESILEEFLEW
jgi:hypothetical protein